MGEIEEKPEAIEGELAVKKIEDLAAAVGAIISPMAESQARTTIEQIHANKEFALEQLRTKERIFNRLFWVLAILVAVGSTIVLTLLFTGKTDAALNAFWFFAGALSGYTGGRHMGHNATDGHPAQ